MITARDPRTITEAERFAEIAELLAKGYVRLQLSRHSAEDRLAACPDSEPSCGSKAMNPKTNGSAA